MAKKLATHYVLENHHEVISFHMNLPAAQAAGTQQIQAETGLAFEDIPTWSTDRYGLSCLIHGRDDQSWAFRIRVHPFYGEDA